MTISFRDIATFKDLVTLNFGTIEMATEVRCESVWRNGLIQEATERFRAITWTCCNQYVLRTIRIGSNWIMPEFQYRHPCGFIHRGYPKQTLVPIANSIIHVGDKFVSFTRETNDLRSVPSPEPPLRVQESRAGKWGEGHR
ncbi:hypothetical protein D3C72_1254340 [compost metagenome]